MTLAELLGEAALDLATVRTTTSTDGRTEFRVGDHLIATLSADGVGEFRLDPLVAEAAQRTPDTMSSERGADWVRFAPATLDAHAADRAVAWLGSAARRAGPSAD